MARPRIPSEAEYLNCIRCGLCLSVCPTYRQNLSESDSPRGRVALARMEEEGLLRFTHDLRARMDGCLDCLACNEICPVGIRPSDLALHMRAAYETIHPSAWKRRVLGDVLSGSSRMESLIQPLMRPQVRSIRRSIQASSIARILPLAFSDMQAMVPELPDRPLQQSLPLVSPATGSSRIRVGFFLGCAQNIIFADQSQATVRVLQKNHCTVVAPPDVACCGMPATAFGRPDLAVEHARFNILAFESTGAEVIVTDCGTCGSTLKKYGRMLEDDPLWAERAAHFSTLVRDVAEFLGSIELESPRGRLDVTVTYHDACHLRRGQGVWRQPRALLRQIDGLNLVELPESDVCCGSAGSKLFTHRETSVGILDRKMRNVKVTTANYVASGCPSCRMQLRVGARRAGLDLRVLHTVELLDLAYRQGADLCPGGIAP